VLIAIYAHAIPCTIGVVGIFLKSGFNNYQTTFFMFVVTFMAFLGCIVGIAVGQISESALSYILTFVAGNFIYVGAKIWNKMLKHSSFLINILELFSFSVGVGAMYLVTLA
jgi:zinc transporter ZupT